MTEPIPITIPLINPNEPGALLVSLDIHSGQHVAKGDLICTLETTKSTQQLVSERDGYLVGLAFSQGQTVQAGDILGYLADSPDELPPAPPTREADHIGAPPGGLRISQA